MIVLRNVSVRYPNGVAALDRVNLQIDAGEFVYLVGATGSGKSTLLKLLYREQTATEGAVYLDGQDVTTLKRRDVPRLRRRLGVVFQDFRLLPYKTARENVSFALQVIGAEPRSIHRLATDSLGLVGLAHRADAMPHELSGGEQQRVCIARAIVNDPAVLLADEPTGNLDPEASQAVFDVLRAVAAHGTTVLVATHDRDMVDRYHARVVQLQAGRVVRDDNVGGYETQSLQAADVAAALAEADIWPPGGNLNGSPIPPVHEVPLADA